MRQDERLVKACALYREHTHTRVQQWATVAADDGAGGGTSALNSCNFTCKCRQEHVAATGCLASVCACVFVSLTAVSLVARLPQNAFLMCECV